MTRGNLAGKVAVVTGGSGGIGRAIIAALEDAGATAVSLDLAALESGPAPAGTTRWIHCDVRDDASVSAAIAQTVDAYERIDIAIHAAGIARDAVVWKLSVEEWDAVQQVNLRGAFLLLRHTVPVMRRGAAGRVVLIGSINGSRGKVGTSAYSASKAGLIGLAKSVSREAGRFGILVNVVEPGWVRTALTEKVDEKIRQAALAETLLGELVDPEDVAAMVLFLCGSGARRVTGQVLRVDAGQYL
jgi:acetoacetyl-CoA reductase/3-oxoacyl-[acyl-carrier protein] reductase